MNQNTIAFIKETKRHKQDVKDVMRIMVNILNEKAANHDDSKLEEPELSKFAEVTPKFKQYAYNSPEYKQALLELGDALKHHYEHNTHHPECYVGGIKGMDLLDIIEMFADWFVSSKQRGGNIFDSIEQNQVRFQYDDTLKSILKNTAININGVIGMFEPLEEVKE